ncbi:hypothetical protein CTEN210_05467 [Chaetoceros tenuissimus]|uniref:Uncharacterized protein n=1 Tax=Chaetoceros tenuissimus TaxID=426638 RepID=A0AAD3H3J7_9STRA|nr:hypothetical protein CTEN210_05467 [Chaetoceros tenuissimus]
MSWHGISVIFYVWNEATLQLERRIYYIDQVLDKTNKQDTWSTATLIEAAIAAVKLDLPQLEKAVVCCDNTAIYSSKYLVILLCIINAKHYGTFYFERLFHTETQDGKGVTDSHFAISMKQLWRFINRYLPNRLHKILTPHGLTFALSWQGGIRNSIVQLVDIDSEHLLDLSSILFKTNTALVKVFRHSASGICFPKPDLRTVHRIQQIKFSDSEYVQKNLNGFQFTIDAAAHSGYRRRVKFHITLEEKKPTVSLDEASRVLVNEYLGVTNEARNETAVTRDDEEEVQEEEVHQGSIFNFNGHDEVYAYDDDDPAYMLHS